MATASVRSAPSGGVVALGDDGAAERNRVYYEALYRPRHPLAFLLHGRVSYDQQSKTKRNRAVLQSFLRQRRGGSAIDVLDFGCGWGTLLLALPRRGVRAHAHDVSTSALANLSRAARLVGRHIAPARTDVDGGLPGAAYDVVVCSHVLEHVPCDRALLADLAAALRPGGVLLANVPIHERWPDPKHVRAYDAGVLARRLEEAGLRVLRLEECDRLTTRLLDLDHTASSSGTIRRVLRRSLRAILALTPLALVDGVERLGLRDTPPHQLIALAVRDEGVPA